MTRYFNTLILATTMAVGLALVPNRADAQFQQGIYSNSYASPYGYPALSGSFYNQYNYGIYAPYQQSYAPWGSYYNYINSATGYGYYGYGGSYGNGAYGYGGWNGYGPHFHHHWR